MAASMRNERKKSLIKASAPGKLYIAGEYAVVTHGHPAILVAVDQFITVTLEETHEEGGTIYSSLNGGLPVPWTRQNGKLVLDERENPFIYITQAVKITEQYLQEQSKRMAFFDLSVESELDDAKGKKYGLGSSGAVTVATIKALLLFYGMEPSPELVYKLSALAHLSVNSNGSFGDLAASCYTGWIAYSCFDREWVKDQKEYLSISELIAREWPSLHIKPLMPPKGLELLIGWTGSPASTTSLVDKVNNKRMDMADFYPHFLRNSKQCVEAIIAAFEQADTAAIQKGILQNRTLLNQLTQHTGVLIETELLTSLINIALKHGGAAKSSGAGGGDCGIVLIEKQRDISALFQEWEQAGILPLPLQVYKDETSDSPKQRKEEGA